MTVDYREEFQTGSMQMDCWFGHYYGDVSPCSGVAQSVDGYRGKREYLPGTKILPSRTVSMKKVVATSAPVALNWPGFGTITGDFAWHMGPGQGGENFSISTSIGSTPEALIDHAVIALLAEVNSPDWEGGVALSELADVVEMFISPFRALNKVCRNWQKSLKSARKALGNARKYMDVVSNSWLQWRYGIVPLIADIETIKELYDKTQPRLEYNTHRKGNRNNGVPLTSVFDTHYVFGNTITCRVQRTESSSTVSTGKAMVSISDEFGTDLGFGLHSVLPGFWERVPFSFIGDWFWNTGDWLTAKNPRPGLSIVDSCLSIKRQKTITWDILSWNASPGGYYRNPIYPWTGGGQANIVWSSLDRIPLPPIPEWPTRNPAFYKWKRALDSAALSWNLIPPIFGKRK